MLTVPLCLLSSLNEALSAFLAFLSGCVATCSFFDGFLCCFGVLCESSPFRCCLCNLSALYLCNLRSIWWMLAAFAALFTVRSVESYGLFYFRKSLEFGGSSSWIESSLWMLTASASSSASYSIMVGCSLLSRLFSKCYYSSSLIIMWAANC